VEILCKFFPDFQTWNRIFFWFCKKNPTFSKIAHIYSHWTSRDPILSEKKKPFWIHHHSLKKFTKEFHVILICVHFTKDSHVIFFYVEILCKIFPTSQTWIGFFSTFFEQNQKTRKLRTFISFELHMIQFWANLKNLFGFFIIHSRRWSGES